MQGGQASRDPEEKADRSVQQKQPLSQPGAHANRQDAQSQEEQTGSEEEGYQGDQYQSRHDSDGMDGAEMK
jgi:hypothetical protein